MPPADVSIRLSMRTALLVLVALLALAGAPGAEAVTVVTQVQATMSFSSQGITGSGPITGTVTPTGQITGSGHDHDDQRAEHRRRQHQPGRLRVGRPHLDEHHGGASEPAGQLHVPGTHGGRPVTPPRPESGDVGREGTHASIPRTLVAVDRALAARCRHRARRRGAGGGPAARRPGGDRVPRDHRAELVRPVDGPAADHAVRRALRDPRRARAPATQARRWGRAWPSRGRRARTGAATSSSSGAASSSTTVTPLTSRGREVQLRALQGGGRAGDAGAGPAGGGRRSADRALPPASEPWPDFMTFYGTTATAAGIVVPKKYVEQVGDGRLPQASRSGRGPTSSSPISPGSRWWWRPTPATGGACPTSSTWS